MKKLLTIGVYGATEDAFFESLVSARVTDFCDIRARRGMRGSTYAFVNKSRLIERLDVLGIRYHHFKELAPSQEVREAQKRADALGGALKRTRSGLGEEFVNRYGVEVLSDFDSREFSKRFEDEAVVCLFCVEARPEACHRSLVAKKLEEDLGFETENLVP